MVNSFLIYGSYGYSGNLITRTAVERGLHPVLAGRDAEQLRLQSLAFELEHQIFALYSPDEIAAHLRGFPLVLHCAGPFSHTSQPMAEACLRSGTHYLDITGEIEVFESLAEMDAAARKAKVMLLPGVGMDVVPSDCLAAYLKAQLPGAEYLTLAYSGTGAAISRGTLSTMVENLPRGGAVRQDRTIISVPAGWKTRKIDFGDGPQKTVLIPWGDVSTAYYTTGIPNIEFYSASLARLRPLMILSRYFSEWLASPWVQSFLKKRVQAQPPGPTAGQRARGRSLFWGEVRNESGERRVARLVGQEGYAMTAQTAIAAVEKVLAGEAPVGFQTPAKAYGPDFILQIEGVTREDIEV